MGSRFRDFRSSVLFLALCALVQTSGQTLAAAELSRAECVRRVLLDVLRPDAPQASERTRQLIGRLPPEKAQELSEILEGIYFVDYQHGAPRLLEFFEGKRKFEELRIARLYDDTLRGSEPAFAGFAEARRFLLQSDDPASMAVLQGTHARAMRGGVEALDPSRLGQIRESNVVGQVPGAAPLSAAARDTIRTNPYLLLVENPPRRPDLSAMIVYPNSATVKTEALDRIRTSHQEVVRRIEQYQAQLRGSTVADPQLTNDLVRALTEERLAWFIREKGRIGPLNSPEKREAYVALAATLQRDLVSIHPFANGNGRSSRLMMNTLLEKEGIPPARVLRPSDDLERPLAEWIGEVQEGVIASRRLQEDLTRRLELGLPLAHSPELLTPAIPRATPVDLKKQGATRILEGHRAVEVNSAQFGAFVRVRMQSDPDLSTAFRADPVATSRRLSNDFEAFLERSRVDFDHQKRGRLELALNFVDPDYVTAFGRAWAENPARWRAKMELWHTDEIVWRGLSRRSKAATDAEVVGMFTGLSSQMVSNGTLRRAPAGAGHEELRRVVIGEFRRYNSDLLDGRLTAMALDHSRAGPGYGTSYGFSTSSDQKVGKAFSMGAMVLADYGKHHAPEIQARLADRIVVGAYRGKKDVELNTLRQVLPDYSNKYPRQKEIMGIGAADPDSVMVVQRIDAEGRIAQSWVRSPDDPRIVWRVRGEYLPVPGATPPADQLLETIHLFPGGSR